MRSKPIMKKRWKAKVAKKLNAYQRARYDLNHKYEFTFKDTIENTEIADRSYKLTRNQRFNVMQVYFRYMFLRILNGNEWSIPGFGTFAIIKERNPTDFPQAHYAFDAIGNAYSAKVDAMCMDVADYAFQAHAGVKKILNELLSEYPQVQFRSEIMAQ